MRWLGVWVVALVVSVAGCDCSSDAAPMTCESSADCPAGFRCIDMMCVAAGDSGARDTGVDRGTMCIDADGDRHAAIGSCEGADDCDDSADTAYPGAREICGNGADDDCDGEEDEPDCACERGE